MICDEVCCNSKSVANPLSNDDVNVCNVVNFSLILAEVISKLFNLLFVEELIVKFVATIDALTAETSTSVAIIDKAPLKDALTIVVIDDDKDVFIDCDTAILIDDVNSEPVNEFATILFIVVSKFAPTFAAVLNEEPLSICFNLIKFAISYKYR
jgi:hypothetical protein